VNDKEIIYEFLDDSNKNKFFTDKTIVFKLFISQETMHKRQNERG
jgi:hypothetical protein